MGSVAIHSLLDCVAVGSPERTAVRTTATAVTYGEVREQSRRLASWLVAAGVGRGDRVLILLPNGPAIIALIMAASRIGALFCVVNPSVKKSHLRHILADSEPALVITGQAHANLIADHGACPVANVERDWAHMLSAPMLDGDRPSISQDPACLIYTSGSTAFPKAVISSHRNILFAAAAIQECLRLVSSDIIAAVLPLSFDYGLYQIFLAFQVGATVALGGAAEVGPRLLAALRDWQVSVLPIVPSLGVSLVRLARRDSHDLPPLRMITNTGAQLSAALVGDLQKVFPETRIFLMFGLTECKRTSILDPADYRRKPGSVGRPLPDTECRILGEDGRLLPPGEVGELVVRGPHVMAGYWRAPDLTAVRFRRWGPGLEHALFSGDRCHMDSEGYLYFHGRQDDIYKQGGFRVSAMEVEAVACSLDGVEHAAVLPPKEGESAILVVTGQITETQVVTMLRAHLEDYKIPPCVRLVNAMPLSLNGKIDKNELRRWAASVLMS
jgi:amino acid adenylation domain-containing protein